MSRNVTPSAAAGAAAFSMLRRRRRRSGMAPGRAWRDFLHRPKRLLGWAARAVHLLVQLSMPYTQAGWDTVFWNRTAPGEVVISGPDLGEVFDTDPRAAVSYDGGLSWVGHDLPLNADPDGSAEVVSVASYEPFGAALTSAGPAATNHAFREASRSSRREQKAIGDWLEPTGQIHLRGCKRLIIERSKANLLCCRLGEGGSRNPAMA